MSRDFRTGESWSVSEGLCVTDQKRTWQKIGDGEVGVGVVATGIRQGDPALLYDMTEGILEGETMIRGSKKNCLLTNFGT